MESALFYVVLFLFLCTGVVTLLGIIQKVSIEKRYLNGLFGALILELVAAVLYLFSNTDFFDKKIPVGDCLIAKSEVPKAFHDKNKEELINSLNTYVDDLKKLKEYETEIDELKKIIKNQDPPYDSVVHKLSEKLAEIERVKQTIADYEVCKNELIRLQKQFLVKMANLNSKISEWGTSVNFRWNPEDKKQVAFMLQEALKEIGFMGQQEVPNNDPEVAYQLLVRYQNEKKFYEVGFLTSEVIAFVIRDYLSR